jgi:hypothetical protein
MCVSMIIVFAKWWNINKGGEKYTASTCEVKPLDRAREPDLNNK